MTTGRPGSVAHALGPFAATGLFIFALAGCGAKASSPFDADTETRYAVPIDASPVRGSAGGAVTVVEFADFQCPYCIYAQPVLDEIRQTYGGRVRTVFKHLPNAYHPWAAAAAELSIEARAEQGDDGFWLAHDALWSLQPSLSGEALEKLGADLGLDAAMVHQAVYGTQHTDALKRDVRLAIALQIEATPCFFIDGRKLVGYQTAATFGEIIDEEIPLIDYLVSQGVDPAFVYDDLMQAAKPPP